MALQPLEVDSAVQHRGHSLAGGMFQSDPHVVRGSKA